MPDATWKAFERWVAGVLGGVRVGNSGRDTVDVAHRWLAPECKVRKRLPQWLLAAMQQAEANAPEDTLPIVVLHQKGDRRRDSLVIMRLQDFVDRLGDDLMGKVP